MNLATILPEGSFGAVSVEHFTVSKADSYVTKMRAAFGHPDEYVPPGKYVRLRVHGEVMMSDTPMEVDTNAAVVREARGDVLVAGLGIGLVLQPILSNPKVRSVTVVEKSQAITGLVLPHLMKLPHANKLDVWSGDILTWKPHRDLRWDTIYFDIWTNICTDNLAEIVKLRRRFARHLRPGGWMGAWRERDLRRRMR